MTVTLDRPISWRNAGSDDALMLEALQPNILKAHTREVFTALFLKLPDRKQGCELLRELATDGLVPALMKSAKDHLDEIAAFKSRGTPGTAYVGVGLSATGYDALGIALAVQPNDVAFQRGMTNHETQSALHDSDVDSWDGHFRQLIDAVVLIGDADKEAHDAAVARVKKMIAARTLPSPG